MAQSDRSARYRRSSEYTGAYRRKIYNDLMWGKAQSILAAVLLLSACASAPVQEMSDARQAIAAARAVISHESQAMRDAERLLEEAELHLRDGHYARAREIAIQARWLAIQARQQAD